MPTTINGIGTHYYGKQNVETRNAACPHCGRMADLRSYDTRLWFCVIFIPVIPLGRKRIIDQCSACTRHGSVGSKEWEKLRGEAIRNAKAEYEAAPNDPEKAIGLHATLAQGGEQSGAEQFAQVLQKQFADNADVQVYLGGCYEERNQIEQSNACFHRAYEIDPTDHTNRQVSAVALVREGRAHEARDRINEAWRSGEKVDPGITFSIATALKEANDAAGAAELLTALGDQSPALRKDKNFRKLAKQVEQSTGAEPGAIAPQQPLTARPAFWWTAAAVVVVLGLVAWDFHLKNSQPLFIVNGLPEPITVTIDGGEPITVRPGRWQRTAVAGGAHTAAVSSPEELAGETAFDVQSGRGDRWLGKSIHVLDPTRSAVVMWEETVYSERPLNRDFDYELVIGQAFRTFVDADYHFEEFPDELQVKDSTQELRKTRVGVVPDVDPMTFVFGDPSWTDDPATLDYIEPHLLYAERKSQLLSIYASAAQDHDQLDRCRSFLESRLERKPIDVDWHRQYQNVAEQTGVDARAAYDALLKDSPRDADLLYLRGRLESFSRGSRPYFDRAYDANPKNAYVLAALAYSKAARGEFEAALSDSRRALAIDDAVTDTQNLHDALQVALGRHAPLEADLQKRIDDSPLNYSAALMMVTSRAARGRPDLALKSQERFAKTLNEEWPADPYELTKRSQLHLHQLLGQLESAAAVAKTLTDTDRRDGYQLLHGLLSKNPARAAEIAASMDDDAQGPAWLWIALAQQAAGERAAVAESIRKSVARLAPLGGDNAEVARLLRANTVDQRLADDALDLDADTETKAAVLLLLAGRGGDQTDRLATLAERLSQLPGDYQPVLKNALSALRE